MLNNKNDLDHAIFLLSNRYALVTSSMWYRIKDWWRYRENKAPFWTRKMALKEALFLLNELKRGIKNG